MAQLAAGDDALRQIVAFARRLSAGSAAPPAEPDRPLRSIFANLQADGMRGDANRYWPALPLEMREEALFPRPIGDLPANRLANLSSDFDKAARPLLAALAQASDKDPLLESLLMLMQRFLVGVPAADAGDTSLYDHARMTGALAAVLAGRDAATLEKSAQPVALLVGGDLSGIQDFIYTITSRGAAGALRGRSFYLQLLTDAVMRHTLRELQLPMTNVVYTGGGKFYLLARAGDAKQIEAIQRHISEVLLRHHTGDLYFSLQSVPLHVPDFLEGQMSAAWGRLSELHQTAKQRQFAELGNDAWGLFDVTGKGGLADKQCQVCGREHPQTFIEPDETVSKCPQCKSYEKLGDLLRTAKFLALRQDAASTSTQKGDYKEALREFGLLATLADNVRDAAKDAPDIVFALADDGFETLQRSQQQSIGRRFITNVVPRIFEADETFLRNAGVELAKDPLGRIKTFDGMAAQAQGIKRLGVLRMDVDNAGRLFSEGLGKRATLARIAHLSFVINLFFEGWAAHLAASINRQDREQQPERGERLYAVYCGGDDLFFVGAWDAIVKLTTQVHDDLARYTSHAGVHASAGVAMITGKYPLFRAAQDAGEAEAMAKRVDGKNAITFLDLPMKWKQFEQVQQRATQFAGWCGDQGVLNHAFLQTLQTLHLESARALLAAAKAGKKPQFTRATWMSMYQISRQMESRRVKESSITAEIEKIRDALQQPNADTQALALAARWAQFMLRESKTQDNTEVDS